MRMLNFVAMLSASAAPAIAQCAPEWRPGETWGMNQPVFALAVLPNGDLAAGGDFTTAGGASVNHIASWNGAAWGTLDTGMNDPVFALVVHPSGDLVAGGVFTTAGGEAANGIARWNGFAWASLGAGVSGPFSPSVAALAVLPNGDLAAGGFFTSAGGVAANHIARWNGLTWGQFGEGMTNTVYALAVLPNGDLVAGGFFNAAGGVTVNRVARWNGTTWVPLGTGVNATGGGIKALAVLPNGDLVVGGDFTMAGGVADTRNIARWSSATWLPLGTGTNDAVGALAVHTNGELVASGWFTSAGGLGANYIARWNGSTWSALGAGIGGPAKYLAVRALSVLPNGDLAAGGSFGSAGGLDSAYIALWGCPPCERDCNGDGQLNLADFGCFQTKFALGDPYADCNGDGSLNLADFGCFQTGFALGCP